MRKDELADLLVAFVCREKSVSFVKVDDFLRPHMNIEGQIAMMLGDPEYNIAIWAGMSMEYYRLVNGLVEAERLFFHPTLPTTYLRDGRSLNMPVAKHWTKRKVLSWSPACLRTVPMPAERPKRKYTRIPFSERGCQ